ncbi:endospore germination permease [Clostridium sp. OS1-26]|uniref:GerAB/ArcD/ProY family transporter n=1 Tax=Clostridium sp. OS1-26 TaxID=3070681 RepID=UPI0027DFA7A0|nr:endospore germination permease [Clostridium sp. OS1-26]WML34570.1 endospore germination permease [Clostridium sp. OS1-26]
MFQSEKISGHQALMLVLAGAIGDIFVVITSPAVKYSGRDAWMSILLAYIIAAIDGLLLINLGRRFPKKTFVQYLPVVLGKFVGKLAGLYYILGFWLMAPIIMRDLIEALRPFLPFTPPIAVNILMSLLAIYVMRNGFEVYARTTELFMPIIIILIISLLCLNFTNENFSNILPIFENGFMPILRSQVVLFPFAVEPVLFMALWLPCLNIIKESKKVLLIGMSISGILLMLLSIVVIGFTGTDMTTKIISPLNYISHYIDITNFLSGFDAFFIILWMLSSYIELLVFYYPEIVGLAQWFNLKDYKPLIIPMVAINAGLAMIPSNIVEHMNLDLLKNPFIILPLGILIPITWLIAVVRKLDESGKDNLKKNCKHIN